ncbi:phospholipase [Bacillus sp. 1NLA3E]|uniref:phospholipase n=1 Tax=Bacillus sp. 1NLA3E TaxID=666686 RepID=UPI000247F043|nr:phospholipase [Bacillus sp. 1NLA3E]
MSSHERNQGLCLFPGYRWCGPGCSGPGAPINDVDACCKSHDKCLRKERSRRCQCDREFVNCLRPKVNFHSEKGRTAALMYGYMNFQTMFSCSIPKR